ncbi:MAG TPA: glycosyltransferase family A protein [Fimbriimonas sp.]|nr:glycosyltransferase family A protein [Fimbriimonas sp.]
MTTPRPDSPTFSLIVTAFNEERYIGAAIESALAQTRVDFELIVVDDGSTDGTVAAVRPYESDPRLHLTQQKNQGLSAARNTGIALAQGELIAFLDSDDLLFPEYLELMAEALVDRPDAGFAYTDAWILDDATNRFRRTSAMSGNNPPKAPPTEPKRFLAHLIESNFIFVSTMVRRKALEEVGNFDVSLTACEDYDLWLRILAAGFGAVSTGGRLAIKRERPSGMTAQHLNMLENLRKVYKKAASNPAIPEDIRTTALQKVAQTTKSGGLLSGNAGPIEMTKSRLVAFARTVRNRLVKQRAWHSETPVVISAAFPGEMWRASSHVS